LLSSNIYYIRHFTLFSYFLLQLATQRGREERHPRPESGQNNEPIYCEPLPPPTMSRAGDRNAIKYFPDPSNPNQITDHIYEYLVSRRPEIEEPPPKPVLNRGRQVRRASKRGSLSSSPSDEGTLSHTSTESTSANKPFRKNLEPEFSSSGKTFKIWLG